MNHTINEIKVSLKINIFPFAIYKFIYIFIFNENFILFIV